MFLEPGEILKKAAGYQSREWPEYILLIDDNYLLEQEDIAGKYYYRAAQYMDLHTGQIKYGRAILVEGIYRKA